MPVSLAKDSIDLGIVVRDADAALAFYRDVLGFDHVEDMLLPGALRGTMHRLMCGTTMIKLLRFEQVPDAAATPGGIAAATGYRYFTITVSNLDEITATCQEAGCPVPIASTEIRPGLRITIVEDPDGNWVELIEHAS